MPPAKARRSAASISVRVAHDAAAFAAQRESARSITGKPISRIGRTDFFMAYARTALRGLDADLGQPFDEQPPVLRVAYCTYRRAKHAHALFREHSAVVQREAAVERRLARQKTEESRLRSP